MQRRSLLGKAHRRRATAILLGAFVALGAPIAAAAEDGSQTFCRGIENKASWPPEPQIGARVPFEPTAFTSGGRAFLTYELFLTNYSTAALPVERLDVAGIDKTGAVVLAQYEDADLDRVLQHWGNPAMGDTMPRPGIAHRQIAPGESIALFLTISPGMGMPIPDKLQHCVHVNGVAIGGPVVETHRMKLQVLGPPLSGADWQTISGPGPMDSHHRRQTLLLGGRLTFPNRFAIDWIRTRDGVSYNGDEQDNRSYYAYGRPVLAVADGTIAFVNDTVPENKPGHFGRGALAVPMSLKTAFGNSLSLDVGDGEFLHYMHLRPGTIHVKVGEHVRRGQVLAEVGDTGSSFEPHLHIELTTSPLPLRGEGLPYVIDDYWLGEDAPAGSSDGETKIVRRHHEMPMNGARVDFGCPSSTSSRTKLPC